MPRVEPMKNQKRKHSQDYEGHAPLSRKQRRQQNKRNRNQQN